MRAVQVFFGAIPAMAIIICGWLHNEKLLKEIIACLDRILARLDAVDAGAKRGL